MRRELLGAIAISILLGPVDVSALTITESSDFDYTVFDTPLDVGLNTVNGQIHYDKHVYITHYPTDLDQFTFTVSEGQVLTDISFGDETKLTYRNGSYLPNFASVGWRMYDIYDSTSEVGGTLDLLDSSSFTNIFTGWFYNSSYTFEFYNPQVQSHEGFDLYYSLEFTTAQNTPTPTPEPTTMILFGTGIAGLAAFGRKNKS